MHMVYIAGIIALIIIAFTVYAVTKTATPVTYEINILNMSKPECCILVNRINQILKWRKHKIEIKGSILMVSYSPRHMHDDLVLFNKILMEIKNRNPNYNFNM